MSQKLKIVVIFIILLLAGLIVFYSPLVSKTLVTDGLETTSSQADYVAGEVLVKFKKGTPERIIRHFKQKLGVTKESFTKSISLYHWTGNFNTTEAIKILTSSKHVQYAEPNYRVRIHND